MKKLLLSIAALTLGIAAQAQTTHILDINGLYDEFVNGTYTPVSTSGTKYEMGTESIEKGIFKIVSNEKRTVRLDLYDSKKPESSVDYGDYVAKTRIEPNGASNSTGGRQIYVNPTKNGTLTIGASGAADRTFFVIPVEEEGYACVDATKSSYVGDKAVLTHTFTSEDAKNATYTADLKAGQMYVITQSGGLYYQYFKFTEDSNSTEIESVEGDRESEVIKTIENGKIIIIKGGVKYDITGRKI